jgi:hypothetical protein
VLEEGVSPASGAVFNGAGPVSQVMGAAGSQS